MIKPQGCSDSTGLGVFLDHSGQIFSLGWGVGFQCMLVAYPYLKTGIVIMTNIELGIHQSEGIIGDILKSLY